jgi:predicted RNase H-like nuclease
VIAGVDGYEDKWIVVVAQQAGGTEIRGPMSFLVLYRDPSLDLIVIDIPIGLADQGYRKADQEARGFLGKRHVCVFTAPIRPLLGCDWLEACARRFALEKKKCSKQQVAIFRKVAEIDGLLRSAPPTQTRVREGHPEVSFTLMNEGVSLQSKHSAEGKRKRLELIQEHFADIGSQWEKWPIGVRKDILDAYALLWTARRISLRKEKRFPERPERDSFGLPMQITA